MNMKQKILNSITYVVYQKLQKMTKRKYIAIMKTKMLMPIKVYLNIKHFELMEK